MSETPGNPEITGQMFLFERPELMNKEQHGGLGFCQPEKRFDFASKVRAIPITVTEIPAAMKDYPIIFMSKENPVLLAVVGLIDDVNLFVDEKGDWDKHCYIPGYVRRYPFGLANETGSDRMAIVIDAAYEGLKPNGELPLFENDAPTEMTQSAIDFCQAFENDRQRTDSFCERLSGLDVIEAQTAYFTPQGAAEKKTFAEYCSVDETKFNAILDEELLKLRSESLLPLIHGLMMSMGNWRPLLQRRAERFELTEDKITDRVIN